jgi:ABC-type glycerol-3-phosphate transport system substrate-binding protein
MTASISRSLLALLATLALAAGLAACGSDDETTTSEESASAEEVTLTTSDTSDGYTWDLSATPTAETKSVTFKSRMR